MSNYTFSYFDIDETGELGKEQVSQASFATKEEAAKAALYDAYKRDCANGHGAFISYTDDCFSFDGDKIFSAYHIKETDKCIATLNPGLVTEIAIELTLNCKDEMMRNEFLTLGEIQNTLIAFSESVAKGWEMMPDKFGMWEDFIGAAAKRCSEVFKDITSETLAFEPFTLDRIELADIVNGFSFSRNPNIESLMQFVGHLKVEVGKGGEWLLKDAEYSCGEFYFTAFSASDHNIVRVFEEKDVSNSEEILQMIRNEYKCESMYQWLNEDCSTDDMVDIVNKMHQKLIGEEEETNFPIPFIYDNTSKMVWERGVDVSDMFDAIEAKQYSTADGWFTYENEILRSWGGNCNTDLYGELLLIPEIASLCQDHPDILKDYLDEKTFKAVFA